MQVGVTVALLIALGLGAGQARAAQNGGADGTALIAYQAPGGLFAARLPGYWKVDETSFRTPGVFFIEPSGRESIDVSFHATAHVEADAQVALFGAIPGGIAPPLRPFEGKKGGASGEGAGRIAGYKALETSGIAAMPSPELGTAQFQVRAIAVLMKSGFFELDHSCRLPAICDDRLFDAFLASFRPGPNYR